jgi:hypothetical protein
MGLLDDAIREHLELKRLRGADPGEVAREQREALDPVPREGRRGEDDRGEEVEAAVVAPSDDDAEDVAAIEGGNVLGEENGRETPEQERDADFSHMGQETAEFDMRAVLGEERGIVEANAAEDGPVQARSLEESEELEVAVEDVLEETPDFLRDTPEQDRLWFEQQPPRDFDFDK